MSDPREGQTYLLHKLLAHSPDVAKAQFIVTGLYAIEGLLWVFAWMDFATLSIRDC